MTLDDLWSAYLDPDFDGGDADFNGLIELGSFMRQGINEMSDVAYRLKIFLRDRTDENVATALQDQGVSLDLVSDFPKFGTEDPELPAQSFREDLIAACDYVLNTIEGEIDQLDGKIDQLGSDIFPDPDMRPLFKCAVTLMGVGLGVALIIFAPPVGVHAAIAAAVGSAQQAGGLVGKWKSSRCREVDLRHAFRTA